MKAAPHCTKQSHSASKLPNAQEPLHVVAFSKVKSCDVCTFS